MKKLLCVLLIAFLFLPSAVLADLPNLSSYSHDELLLLNDQLQQILFDASLPDGILVPAGKYIVGVLLVTHPNTRVTIYHIAI